MAVFDQNDDFSDALALVLLGASGKTFDELAAVLGLASGVNIQANSHIVHQTLGDLFSRLVRNGPFNTDEELSLGIALFVQNNYPVRPEYREAAESLYMCEVRNMDFSGAPAQAQADINRWVSDRTNGKIRSLLEDTPPTSTRVIIASALYFRGAWEKPFFEGLTRRKPFYANGRGTPSTSMPEMMSNGGAFPYYRDNSRLHCEIMGFPYRGNGTTMYVIIPSNSNTQRLRDLEAKLTPDDIERLVSNTKYQQSVILFPKMTLESSIDLSDALRQIGVTSLFNPGEANLGVLSAGDAVINSANKFGSGLVSGGAMSGRPALPGFPVRPPPSGQQNDEDAERLIFSRFGGLKDRSKTAATTTNCSEIFNATSALTECQEVDLQSKQNVTYKKFGDKIGRKINRRSLKSYPVDPVATLRDRRQSGLDGLRQSLNSPGNAENPGLYADKVLHKVFMEVTETGTEAAAATGVTLARGGDVITFRVDIPFLFFIRNEATKLVLFWGTVTAPSTK